MDTHLLDDKFVHIGARLKLAEPPQFRGSPGAVRLDVRSDRKGEYFEIRNADAEDAEVSVLDVQPRDRHLLLLVRQNGNKSKFLCGHDERHWFIAGIPESAPVGTVRQAKEALKPREVQLAQAAVGLSSKAADRRHNAAYIRQGEWFFIPVADMAVDPKLVIRNEPLSRGRGSKPHMVEFCHRTGGETVHVCRRHPGGVSPGAYRIILQKNPEASGWGWRVMQRNALVFVRGRVRHADHATINLRGWHRVVMNTENQSRAMRHVAFLD